MSRIKPHLWFTLYALLRLGAGRMPVRVSTTELSRVIEGSQQSASRHLQILEEEGLIARRIDPSGSLVSLTEDGVGALNDVLRDLRMHIEGAEEELLAIEGEVVSGLFEGAYYISKEGYRGQIEEKLGFDPFPGTLNIRIRDEDMGLRKRLERMDGVRLEGFKEEERAFGAATCYPLMLNGEVEGALIVADRTSHDPTVLEIISPVYLRRHFGLKDGDRVRAFFSSPRLSSS